MDIIPFIVFGIRIITGQLRQQGVWSLPAIHQCLLSNFDSCLALVIASLNSAQITTLRISISSKKQLFLRINNICTALNAQQRCPSRLHLEVLERLPKHMRNKHLSVHALRVPPARRFVARRPLLGQDRSLSAELRETNHGAIPLGEPRGPSITT